MRLFKGKIPAIAAEIVRALTESGGIEVENAAEAQADFEAVMNEYLRREREVVDEAKHRMESRGLGFGQLGRIKAQVAKEQAFPTQEETLPYLIEQLLEMLFHSANVAEIFAEDGVLRQQITPILRKHMDVEDEIDREVRAKIKNLEEGTASFEVEYARVLDQIRRKKGLS